MSIKETIQSFLVGKNSMRGALTVAVVTFVLAYVSVLTFFGFKEANAHVVDIILGALLRELAQVTNYFFGSSQSSTDKDKAISEKLNNQ